MNLETIKKHYHHVVIVLILALLSWLSSSDNHEAAKGVSRTFMIWTLLYVAFLVISLVRQRSKAQ